MIRHRTLGFAEEGNATARAAAISSWDAMIERLKATETSGLPGERLTTQEEVARFLTDRTAQPGIGQRPLADQIQAWLDRNKTAVYVSAVLLIGLAVMRRR